jgi:hypothetical protein
MIKIGFLFLIILLLGGSLTAAKIIEEDWPLDLNYFKIITTID